MAHFHSIFFEAKLPTIKKHPSRFPLQSFLPMGLNPLNKKGFPLQSRLILMPQFFVNF